MVEIDRISTQTAASSHQELVVGQRRLYRCLGTVYDCHTALDSVLLVVLSLVVVRRAALHCRCSSAIARNTELLEIGAHLGRCVGLARCDSLFGVQCVLLRRGCLFNVEAPP